MQHFDLDFIFIAGAPGSGKSTIAKLLHEHLHCPLFEFGWIPEFRELTPSLSLSAVEEENLAFLNLVCVIKNYRRFGFKNVIVTDLDDRRHRELYRLFSRCRYLLFTLTVEDDADLGRRVLDESRSSGYRDDERAIRHNQMVLQRPLLSREIRVNNGSLRPPEDTLQDVLRSIAHYPQGVVLRAQTLPPRQMFYSYLTGTS